MKRDWNGVNFKVKNLEKDDFFCCYNHILSILGQMFLLVVVCKRKVLFVILPEIQIRLCVTSTLIYLEPQIGQIRGIVVMLCLHCSDRLLQPFLLQTRHAGGLPRSNMICGQKFCAFSETVIFLFTMTRKSDSWCPVLIGRILFDITSWCIMTGNIILSR